MTLGDFSKQAEAYGRSRPAYPAELVDELVAAAGLQAGDRVADFGAGTGIFTAMLIDRGLVVSAVEPNESMRQQANLPRADWIRGSFEDSHLATASQHWAVAAQSFHWADPPRALPEVRRILRPRSVFTLLWNDRVHDLNDCVTWAEALIRQHVPEFDEAYRHRAWDQILESTGDFQFLQHRRQRHSITMSRARFLDLWRSHNRLNTIAGPERFERFFVELQSRLQDPRFDAVEVRYDCNSWSARRVG